MAPARGRPVRGSAEAAAGVLEVDLDLVDELDARRRPELAPGRGSRRWVCAIYRVLTTPKVLVEEAAGRSSAAIADTNLGIGTNGDANIGQTAPVHPLSFRRFERGIASCSDRRTLVCGSAIACGVSLARPGIVPGLAWPGVGPLQQAARHGPHSPGIAPRPVWWAVSCRLRGRSVQPGYPARGWSGVVPAPTPCAPRIPRGGSVRLLKKEGGRPGAPGLPHVVRGGEGESEKGAPA
jgi:hypothetical protein